MLPVALSVALMLLAEGALAQTTEEDGQEQPWKEVTIELPAAPKQDDLLPFYVSATATQSFAIDARSLTVGTDGVIRFTLVSTSEAGARNVSYEGVRCATFEKKLYAFGQSDGTWTRSRRDEWLRISDNAANRQHAALAKDYFCLEKTVAGTPNDMVRRLRYQRTLTPQ